MLAPFRYLNKTIYIPGTKYKLARKAFISASNTAEIKLLKYLNVIKHR